MTIKNGIFVTALSCILLTAFTSCHRRHHKRHNKTTASTPKPRPQAKPVVKPRTLTPAEIKQKYATILGVSPKSISNYTLYQFIDKWYGTPYHIGGKTQAGIDCSAFAQRLYGDVYHTNLLRTAMEQFGNCKRIKHSKDAIEGDLVFFCINSKNITHVGVYLANDRFVHASTSGGVMISSLKEEYWHKYYAGCGRIPRG